jgi:hypothetical protein
MILTESEISFLSTHTREKLPLHRQMRREVKMVQANIFTMGIPPLSP